MPDARCDQRGTGEAILSDIFLYGNKATSDFFSWGVENCSFELGKNFLTKKNSRKVF